MINHEVKVQNNISNIHCLPIGSESLLSITTI